MNCAKAEKLISKLLDGRLEGQASNRLEEHLKVCPSCAQLLADYKRLKEIMSQLREKEMEPLPYFDQRLKAKLRAEARPSIWAAAERWYAAAVPIFLVVAMVMVGLLFLFQPAEVQMSQSEMLLFQNQSPLKDTQTIFEEQKPESRQIKLLLAGLENQEIIKRGKQ
ncbi:MAG: anti-sigma factor family protein [Candidatus Saccharicenans sp.]